MASKVINKCDNLKEQLKAEKKPELVERKEELEEIRKKLNLSKLKLEINEEIKKCKNVKDINGWRQNECRNILNFLDNLEKCKSPSNTSTSCQEIINPKNISSLIDDDNINETEDYKGQLDDLKKFKNKLETDYTNSLTK